MKKIHEVMTPDAQCVKPDDDLQAAASIMRQLDVGAVPICGSDRLVGMITDRDIVVRVVAEGKDARSTKVKEAMTEGVVYVYDDQDVQEAVEKMEEYQIRRLPVISREKRLVGMLALGDIAEDTGSRLAGEALREVSHPAEPRR